MSHENALTRGPLTESCRHICTDMQRLFAEDTDWFTPWMGRVLPNARRIVEAHPAETIFTRFIPVERPGEGFGRWKQYYERLASMTIERLGREMIELARARPRVLRAAGRSHRQAGLLPLVRNGPARTAAESGHRH